MIWVCQEERKDMKWFIDASLANLDLMMRQKISHCLIRAKSKGGGSSSKRKRTHQETLGDYAT